MIQKYSEVFRTNQTKRVKRTLICRWLEGQTQLRINDHFIFSPHKLVAAKVRAACNVLVLCRPEYHMSIYDGILHVFGA